MSLDKAPSFHLRSAKFPVLEDEEEEFVNEGTYGKALAVHLEERLKSRGFDVPFVICEDWGWWVEISGQPFSLGCCVYGASHSPTQNDLYVTLSRCAELKWSFLRFKFIDTRERVESVSSTLLSIFTDDAEVEVVDRDCEYPL